MAFWAKVMTDFTAWGARFLKERPCTCLCKWMVYSRVTTSWRAERVLPPVYVFIFVHEQSQAIGEADIQGEKGTQAEGSCEFEQH